MSENTLSEQIEIIIHDVLDQQPTLKSCKIIKNYSTGNFVDIRLSSDEILKYIQCIGDNTVGSEAVLCFMENNFKNPVVISDSSNALCELRDLIDNIEVGEVDLSDYVSESVLNSILSSYVTSDYANMNYALKSDLFSGNYEDLTNKPHIPSKTSDLINDTGFLTNHQSLSDYLTWEEFNSLISSYALSSALNNYYTKLESDERYASKDHSHNQYLTSHQDITGKENISNKVSSWSNTPNNTNYPSEKLVKDSVDSKADILHGHTIDDITTPMYSSAQIDKMLMEITGDTAIDVMNKIGMVYFLRNQTVYDISAHMIGLQQGIMEYGVSNLLLGYVVNEEGVYFIRKDAVNMVGTDLFYYYDGESKITLLTPMKVDWSISNSNPNIDSTITVRARITDMFDNPICYENITLNYEAGGMGASVNLISDYDGYVSYQYKCTSWGQCRFSIKTYDTYINIANNPYPVGAIYISVDNTNPSKLFGGEWTQLTETFLYASTTADTGNTATDGSKNAVVVSHNHTQNAHSHKGLEDGIFVCSSDSLGVSAKKGLPNTSGNYGFVYSAKSPTITRHTTTANTTATNQSTGVDGTDKNMPPYMKVYMWKRIS